MEPIHARLRRWREARGWSLEIAAEKISEALGVPLSWQAIQQWEDSKKPRIPRKAKIVAIARTFGVTPKEVEYGEEPKQTKRSADVHLLALEQDARQYPAPTPPAELPEQAMLLAKRIAALPSDLLPGIESTLSALEAIAATRRQQGNND